MKEYIEDGLSDVVSKVDNDLKKGVTEVYCDLFKYDQDIVTALNYLE